MSCDASNQKKKTKQNKNKKKQKKPQKNQQVSAAKKWVFDTSQRVKSFKYFPWYDAFIS